MRKIFLAVFLLVSFVSFSQEVTSFPTVGLIQFPKTNGIGYRGVGADSLLWLPSDTIHPAASIVGKAHAAIKNGVLYYWDGSKWAAFSGGGGSGTVTSVATGYGLAGGTITTTGTLRWDSATGYLTGLRRKDSATGTNLNGYLTRTSVRTYSPGIDDVLAIGQKLTANRTIDLNGGWLYKISDGSYYESWDGYDWTLRMRAGHTFDIQIPNGSDLTEFKTTDGEVLGQTTDVGGGTTAKLRSNQDLAEMVTTKTATGGTDIATVLSRYSSSNLTAELSVNPVSHITWGFVADRNYHGVKMGIAASTNSNNFRGIRIDSNAFVYIDTALSGASTDSVLVWNATTKKVNKRNASAFSGGSTPTLQQVLTAGSTLTGDNTIDGGGYSLTLNNNSQITLHSSALSLLEAQDATGYSGIGVTPTYIGIAPPLGNLKIDTLNTFSDTSSWKPLVYNTSTTEVKRATYWPTGSGGH